MKKESRYLLILTLIFSLALIGCDKGKESNKENKKLFQLDKAEIENLHGKKLEGGIIERVLTSDKVLFMKEIIDSKNKVLVKEDSLRPETEKEKISPVYEPVIYDFNNKEEQKFNNIKTYYNYSASPKGNYLIYDEVRDDLKAKQSIKVLNVYNGEIKSLEMPSEANLKDIRWHGEEEFTILLEDNTVPIVKRDMYKYNVDTLECEKIDLKLHNIIGIKGKEIYYYDFGLGVYEIYKINIENMNKEEVCSNIKIKLRSKLSMFNDVFVVEEIDETKYTKKELEEEKRLNNYVIRIYDMEGILLNETTIEDYFSLKYVKYDKDEKNIIYLKHESNYSSLDKVSYIKKIDLESGETKTLLASDNIGEIYFDNDYMLVETKAKYDFTVSSYVISNFDSGEKVAHKTNEANKKIIESAWKNYKGRKDDRDIEYLYQRSIILNNEPCHYIENDRGVVLLNNDGKEVKLDNWIVLDSICRGV